MTGEITLRGLVLPIGGLKEKSLAAAPTGITRVLIPELNEKDLQDIPGEVKKCLEFVPVKTVDVALELALENGTIHPDRYQRDGPPRQERSRRRLQINSTVQHPRLRHARSRR